MNPDKLQDLIDQLAIFKACKTEEEARRAGILVGSNEVHRKLQEVKWAEHPVLIRSTDNTFGIGGNFPSLLSKDGEWEPQKCCMCDEHIEIGETYRIAQPFFVAHDKCLKV